MATDIILAAPEPTYVLPDNMVLNPIMDIDLFIGIPVWAWLIALIGVIFVGIMIRWLFRWNKMAAVKGYRDKITSADLKSQQVWYLGINKTFSIYCLKFEDRILSFYDYLKNLDKWCLSSVDATGSCGGVSMMMVSGGYDQVKDPPSEVAVCTAAEDFNNLNALDKDGNPQFFMYKDENGVNQRRQKIIKNNADFIFFLPVMQQMWPRGIAIPSYCFYDSSKNQEFTPKDCSAKFFGARRTKMARELRMRMPDDSLLKKLAPLAIAFACGVVASIFVYMVVTGT